MHRLITYQKKDMPYLRQCLEHPLVHYPVIVSGYFLIFLIILSSHSKIKSLLCNRPQNPFCNFLLYILITVFLYTMYTTDKVQKIYIYTLDTNYYVIIPNNKKFVIIFYYTRKVHYE